MKKAITVAMTFIATLFTSAAAFAQETTSAVTATGQGFDKASALAIASGLGIAIAAFGGALGQGKAATATLEGIARNPGAAGKLLTPMIIALALIESLVIYALVIAFLLQAKI